MNIVHLDHLVLTVADIDATCAWYERVLGMEVRWFGEGRRALHFGSQKINLHLLGQERAPKAASAAPGSADLCFITTAEMAEITLHLLTQRIEIAQGPVQRSGALGPIRSVYVRDPDQNLIEIATYRED